MVSLKITLTVPLRMDDQLKTLILILPNLRLILYLETNIVGRDRRESISVFGTVYLRDHVNINL